MKKLFLISILLSAIACTQIPENTFSEAQPVWAEGRQSEKNLTLSFIGYADGGKGEEKATVKIAASTDYRLFLNGEFVAHGPCVAAHNFYRMDKYEVVLTPGENIFAFEVAGYNEPSYYLLDQPSFLQAEVMQGNKIVCATGRDINAYELKQRKADVERFSFQRPFVEEYNLQENYKEWTIGEVNEQAQVVLAVQDDKTIIPRGVPTPDYRVHQAEQINDNIFKFTCNSSGFLIADVKVSEPSRLVLAFDELLTDEGHVNDKRLGCNASVTYNLAPGTYTLECFEPYTMQYVEVRVENGNAEVTAIRMRDYCNSAVNSATFKSSDENLNRLFETARETLRQSSLDVFMDTPSRERAGWLCDSYFSARVAFDFIGNTALEHNFIENFILPEKFKDIDEGMLPMCYPSDHWNHNYIPNWAMFFVLQLEEYLHRSGDRELVDKAKDRVYALVEYFKPYLNEYGLLEKLSKWVFVEWSKAADFVQDVNYPSNMLYAEMLDAISRLYSDDALAQQAAALRETIRKMSFDGKYFCDNAVREDGKLIRTTNHTEVCQYYAFYFGIASVQQYSELWNSLVTEFGPSRTPDHDLHPDVPVANAFIGNYLRLELLAKEGYTKDVIDNINGFFTKMADLTGTLWEHMSTNASCNHCFASHIAHVMYRDGLGINDIDPVEKTVKLHFTDNGLNSCEGKMPIGDDFIELKWTRNPDGTVKYDIKLPEGWESVEI